MKLLISLLLLLTLGGCAAGKPETDTFRRISMQEAAVLMAQETDYIILDVRTQEEYDAGHIPNAICIPNETIGNDAISALPNKEQLILVYCRSGNRSKQAAGKLVQQGYTNIVEFGGILDWQGEIVTQAPHKS